MTGVQTCALPIYPDPVGAGVALFGIHPPSVDAACAYLMGLDADKIPIVARAFECRALPLSEHPWREVRMRSNDSRWNRHLVEIAAADTFHFKPHFGWKDHIERASHPIRPTQTVEAVRHT